MAELSKQDVVNDQYYISTTASLSGEGKYLSTASNNNLTPLFLNAVPQITGKNFTPRVAFLTAEDKAIDPAILKAASEESTSW